MTTIEVQKNYASRTHVFFPNRSVKQRQDILTNKLAANTHVIVRKTQNSSVRCSK